MSSQLPALTVVVPLLTAFGVTAAGWVNRRWCIGLAAGGLALTAAVTVLLLHRVVAAGSLAYHMGGWPPPWGIAYRVDGLNALVAVLVAGVGGINLIATRREVVRAFGDRLGAFYALYLLFVTGLLGIVLTGDAFNLYVLLEIAALTGYALIGLGRPRAALSSLNYVFLGTIGASLYLLGIGYLYLATGTLNMADIGARLPAVGPSRVVGFAFAICMAGLFVKMGLFPFHAWLPNAYATCPPAVASLIAPLTTKVMIYVMMRLTLSVFVPGRVLERVAFGPAAVWLATAAVVAGSLLALGQRRLTRMLTYVIVAEVGYMVGGFWLGNRAGVTGAMLHIINDGVMTLCVFLAAGSVAPHLSGDRLEDLKGLFQRVPLTMAAFVTGALSIIGVPPTCGFFSKWYLLSGAVTAGHYGFAAALIFSSLVAVVLFFRIIEIAYFNGHDDGGHGPAPVPVGREAALDRTICLVAVAAGLIALGFANAAIAEGIIAPLLRHVM